MVTESSLVIARGWQAGKWRMIGKKYGVSLWGDENILELDSGEDCTTR